MSPGSGPEPASSGKVRVPPGVDGNMESVSTETSTPVDLVAARQLTEEFDEPQVSEDNASEDTAGEHESGEEALTDEKLMRIALDAAVEAIRPAIQMDGGDMIVLELRPEEGVVDIELTGACVGCPMSSVTLKQGVERILTERVPGLSKVRAKGIDFDVQDDIW